ncbi:hypothetical protein EAF04_003351 [Stromatinia cepivora]|nr:hypothetical protein EAF04_003351 [Stromatinia cepivora]
MLSVEKWQNSASEVQKHRDATITKVEPAIAKTTEELPRRLPPNQALARAKEIDEHFTKSGPTGPLHGLPISVKAHIGMKDLDNTCGLVGWVGRKDHDDANILKIFLTAGAVLYVRTNEPQGLMMLRTVNNIIDRTTNPHNAALTQGGSSGGESALQALGGISDVLQLNVDFTVYVQRPSAFHLYDLLFLVCMGCDTIAGTIGPLSRSLKGVDLFMKVALDSKPWTSDSSLHQTPWIN